MSRGAQLGWLIDPIRKLAMIYRPGREPETLLQPEFLEGEGPVAGFPLKMQRLWADRIRPAASAVTLLLPQATSSSQIVIVMRYVKRSQP